MLQNIGYRSLTWTNKTELLIKLVFIIPNSQLVATCQDAIKINTFWIHDLKASCWITIWKMIVHGYNDKISSKEDKCCKWSVTEVLLDQGLYKSCIQWLKGTYEMMNFVFVLIPILITINKCGKRSGRKISTNTKTLGY